MLMKLMGSVAASAVLATAGIAQEAPATTAPAGEVIVD